MVESKTTNLLISTNRKMPLERARKPQDRREGLGWYLEASGELEGLESPVKAPSVDFPIWETFGKFLHVAAINLVCCCSPPLERI